MRLKALAGHRRCRRLVLSACGGGGDEGGASSEQSGSVGPTFGTPIRPACWPPGFENADEVGTSRLDYAKVFLARL